MNEFGNQITFKQYVDTDECICAIKLRSLNNIFKIGKKKKKEKSFLDDFESGKDEEKDDYGPEPPRVLKLTDVTNAFDVLRTDTS